MDGCRTVVVPHALNAEKGRRWATERAVALLEVFAKQEYVIYGGLREAARTSFRVCALGA